LSKIPGWDDLLRVHFSSRIGPKPHSPSTLF